MICEKCNHRNECKEIIYLYQLTCTKFFPNSEYIKLWKKVKENDIIYYIEKDSSKMVVIREAKVMKQNYLKNGLDLKVNILCLNSFNMRYMHTGVFYLSKEEIYNYLKERKCGTIIFYTYNGIKIYNNGDKI